MKPRKSDNGMYLFYGTLRSGQWNNLRFPSFVPIGTEPIKISGFQMVDIGGIPAAIFTGDDLDYILCERFYIPDEKTRDRVDALESGYQFKRVLVDDTAYGIYYFSGPRFLSSMQPTTHPRYTIIPGGDWVKYCNETYRR
jgi:gamma-glutamylcyclotransferase (GGCT)/AIG2-like uncharacterized protein YtfP